MEIGTSYIKEVSQVNKSNAVSAYPETEEKTTVDYSNYSISEILDIPYEEAKENYEQVMEKVADLQEKFAGSDELSKSMFQFAKVNFSDNDKLNEALYETMRSFDNPIDAVLFEFEMTINMKDYYYEKETTASFQMNEDGSNHAHKELNSTQLSNINMDDFIDKMLATFTEDYASAKSGTIKEQYKGIVDGYRSFKENYDKAVTEPYYA